MPLLSLSRWQEMPLRTSINIVHNGKRSTLTKKLAMTYESVWNGVEMEFVPARLWVADLDGVEVVVRSDGNTLTIEKGF